MSFDIERAVNARAAAYRGTRPGELARISAVIERVHQDLGADIDRAQERAATKAGKR